MSDLIDTLKDVTKDVPAWVWWVGGGVVLVVFVVLSRNRGAGQYIPAPSTETPSAPPPPATVDLSGIESALTGLGSYVASSTAALRADQRTTAATVATINQNVASVLSATQMMLQTASVEAPGTSAPAQVSPSTMTSSDLAKTTQPTSSVQAVAPQQVTFQGWIDNDKLAGYVPVTVTVDNTFEQGIIDAKSKYATAEQAGDKAGMDAARLEADRLREAAKQAGATLDRELQSGTQLYPQ